MSAKMMLAVREIKQELEISNHAALPPNQCEEDAAAGLASDSAEFKSNQGVCMQVYTKTDPEASEGQQQKSRALMDIVIKQEIVDAEDYLVVPDQMEVSEDEDASGAEADHLESPILLDYATIVKSEEETFMPNVPATDFMSEQDSISDLSKDAANQQQATRMDRKQDETFQECSIGETDNTCSLCGKVFDKSQAYLRHMWQNHTGEKPYICHFCGKTFKNIKKLNRHKITHSNERPFLCNLCQKSFKLKTSLVQHTALCHSDERPFSCKFCEKAFKLKSVLERHIVTCHSDERPHCCDLCEKTFKQKASLAQHIATCHSDERPYSCKFCEKTFKLKSNLARHIATCHSDERPYSCDICEKTFKEKSVLERHVALCHSDERPYSCDICEKTFKQNAHVHRHKRECHSDERS